MNLEEVESSVHYAHSDSTLIGRNETYSKFKQQWKEEVSGKTVPQPGLNENKMDGDQTELLRARPIARHIACIEKDRTAKEAFYSMACACLKENLILLLADGPTSPLTLQFVFN